MRILSIEDSPSHLLPYRNVSGARKVVTENVGIGIRSLVHSHHQDFQHRTNQLKTGAFADQKNAKANDFILTFILTLGF